MLVKLTHDTAVRFSEGTVLEVSEQEGKRLIAFGNAVEEKKAEPEKTTKKTKRAAK